MDNEHIDDTNNFYASISFYIHQRLDNVIYEICSITIEEQFDNENLETFIRKVIEWLPIIEDNVRVALSNSPLDTTYALSTENHITECINQIMQRVR